MSDASPDISKLAALDDDEWLRVERAYCGRLMAYVSRRVADRASREDIVQEAFLGAVRGIRDFDPSFTFEQYLFGIARNKLIDHFRKAGRPEQTPAGTPKDPDQPFDRMAVLATSNETPSRILVDRENVARRKGVLVRILRQLVKRYWEKGEFHKLKTVELIFRRNEKYPDIVRKTGVRDERAVAMIKFQAIQELQKMARSADPHRTLFSALWSERR